MYLVDQLRSSEYLSRVERLKLISEQRVVKKDGPVRADKLHVVYLLGHVSVCGGVKVILEHANQLVQHGVRVTLLSHFPKPDWFEVRAAYHQVPFGIDLARGIPLDCDVVVATYWDQLGACVEACAAPVVYFEQGDFHLWDWEKVNPELQEIIHHFYRLPAHVITCSATGARKIKEVFQRESTVFFNALNSQVFFPKSQPSADRIVLGVGRDTTPFKRLPDIWQACRLVQEQGYPVEFRWVTPYPPVQPMGTIVLNPSQAELGNVYRQAWVYVCASEYETFPLPPLEAMACGTPVITTPNDGVKAYAVEGENCLFYETGNTRQLAATIIRLLEQPDLYKKLQAGGYQTAKKFSWQQVIPQLKAYYAKVAGYQPVLINQPSEWEKLLPVELTAAEQQAVAQVLGGTTADLVYLPFIYKLIEFSVVRWRPVFYRKKGSSGRAEFLYGLFKAGSLAEHPYSLALEQIQMQNYCQALAKFKKCLDKTNNPREAAVLIRWLAWCLLKLERFSEAHRLMHKGMQLYPDFADFYYLYALFFRHRGFEAELPAMQNTLQVLGDGAGYPEYIKDIATLPL
ncbi:hypothetical protein JCM39194_03900 [Desulfotomaculum varum]